MSVSRIIVFSLCAMVVLFGQFLWLGYWYGDILDAKLQPSFLEEAAQKVCLVALWPFAVTTMILGHDPKRIYCLLLWILTGLFWGVIIEQLFIMKSSHKVLSRNLPNRKGEV